MEDFLKNIGTVYWWISVVAVGILINIFSAYLKTKMDTTMSQTSNRWRQWSEAQRTLKQKTVEGLRQSTHEQTLMSVSALESDIHCTVYLVFAVLFFVLTILVHTITPTDPLWWPWRPAIVPRIQSVAKFVFMFCSTACMLMFINSLFEGRYKKTLIREARSSPSAPNVSGNNP